MSDVEKLRVLADWHDIRDDERSYEGEREVQTDLRLIADHIEALEADFRKERLSGNVARRECKLTVACLGSAEKVIEAARQYCHIRAGADWQRFEAAIAAYDKARE